MRLFVLFLITISCGVAMANGEFCNQLLSQISQDKLIYPGKGIEVAMRSAQASDVGPVTELIHQAFDIWAKEGLRLRPMFQNEAETSSHLLGKGFVAIDNKNMVVGTFSVEDGSISASEPGIIAYREGSHTINFLATAPLAEIRDGKYLVFRKLAVAPTFGQSGLGLYLYQSAEEMARLNGYSGVALETVKEASWLFDWYVKLGFKVIGTHRYTGSKVETLLMIKNF
jgi:predicted N-acetyltransferase YhbS